MSNRLSRLVEAGLFVRVPYRDRRRTRHEYRLTTAGADVLGILHALAGWGQDHTEPERPVEPMRVVHLACGSDLPPSGHCPACGSDVERTEMGWVRPWRSADAVPLADPA